MDKQIEIISYDFIPNINVFINKISYRTAHFHPAIEIGLLIEGSAEFVFSGKKHFLSENDIVIINQDLIHEIRNNATGALILFIQFPLSFLKGILPNIRDLFFDSNIIRSSNQFEEANLLKELMIEFTYRYLQPDYVSQMKAIGYFNIWFAELLRILDHHFLTLEEQQNTRILTKRIEKLINYVDENYMNKIVLSEFASREGLSIGHVSRFIKNSLGQNFQEYVTERRYQLARKLLACENMSIIDICLESGFSDPRYLTKAFIDRTGLTPDEFRKSGQENSLLDQSFVTDTDPYSIESIYSNEDSLNLVHALRDPVNLKNEI